MEKILEGFKDPMIMILLVALVVQVVLVCIGQAEWFEPVGVLIAILIANGVSSISEYRQENKASALKQEEEAKETAKVLRNGKTVSVSLPGDLNLLEMLEEPRFAEVRMPLVVDSVVPESPAEKIGLSKGSTITKLNNKEIKDFNDLSNELAMLRTLIPEDASLNDSLKVRTVSLCIQEGDSVREAEVLLTPEVTFGFVNKTPEYKTTTKEYGFFESLPAGVAYGWNQLTSYVSDLKYIFTKKGAQSVGGFITIGNIFPGVWDWQSFWMLTALLSIMLGVVNVLPIPALDGGHALFCIYEIVTGRKPSDTFLQRAQYVGFFLLLGLLIFANLNDILRLFGLM